MNLTINALYLCLLTAPTFTFLHQNLNINNAHVSYSFSHFIYGNNMRIQKNLIMHSSFNRFLSTPIKISNDELLPNEEKTIVSNLYIKSPLYYTNCCDYQFISNTFFNCISRADYKFGGAIYINCENRLNKGKGIEINVQITNNCFLNCESDQGGAFYITCNSATIQENSFRCCEAVYYSFLYLQVKQEALFTQTHFILSKKDESTRGKAIYTQSDGTFVGKNINISSNKLNSAHSAFYVSSPPAITPKYIYLNFYNNTSKYVFSSYSIGLSIVENSNFIRNQGIECLLEFQMQIKCQSCAFISDNSRSISSRYTIFAQCSFDDSEDNIKANLPTFSNCQFNTDKTIDVKIDPTHVCMTEPSDNTGSSKKVFLASFMPIFIITLVVIAVLVIFYGIKHGWFRKKTDTIPLMYV